jgi:hypothetical protein
MPGWGVAGTTFGTAGGGAVTCAMRGTAKLITITPAKVFISNLLYKSRPTSRLGKWRSARTAIHPFMGISPHIHALQ